MSLATEFLSVMLDNIQAQLDVRDNYQTWSLDMQMLSEAKDYWQLIDGTETWPAEAGKERQQQAAWAKTNWTVVCSRRSNLDDGRSSHKFMCLHLLVFTPTTYFLRGFGNGIIDRSVRRATWHSEPEPSLSVPSAPRSADQSSRIDFPRDFRDY